MKAGLAPRTAQYAVAVVSLLWNTAFAQEFVTGENPARRVRRPKIDNRRLRFLSKDEADALLAEMFLWLSMMNACWLSTAGFGLGRFITLRGGPSIL